MIVAPGIVDVHTHYDPQITFDPYATISCFHGVTTVVAGNCGFSVAPCKPEDRAFLSGIFARVENMDPDRAERDHVGRVRDVPRVPRQPRGEARRELRVLHRPLEPPALGDGRRRVRAHRHCRRDRRDARDGHRGDGRRARPGCRRRPRPRTSTSTTGRCRRGSRAATRCWRWRRRPGTRARDRSRTCRRARSAGSTHTDEDYLIELSTGERPAGGDPGARRPQQDRRAHRHVGGGAVVPRPRRPRRARPCTRC